MAKKYKVLALLVSVLALLIAPVSSASAQDEESSAAQAEAVRLVEVDNSRESLTATLVSVEGDLDFTSAAFQVAGEDAIVSSATQVSPESTQIALVVDVGDGVQAEQLQEAVSAIEGALESLDQGVAVSLIEAGTVARVVNGSANPQEAIQELSSLSPAGESDLSGAISLAVRQLEDTFEQKTVVLVTPGTGSVDQGFADDFVVRGIQLVVAPTGESVTESISRLTDISSGFVVQDESLATSIAAATSIARWDYELVNPEGLRGRQSLDVTVGSTQLIHGFDANAITTGGVALNPPVQIEAESSSFFSGQIVFYISLVLAAGVIAFAVFMIANLILQYRENSIDGVLSSYIGDNNANSGLSQADQLIQSAIVKKAVSATETIAEGRGFTERINSDLEKADLPLRAGEALLIAFGVTIVLGALVGFTTRSFLAVGLVLIMSVVASVLILQMLARRRLRKFELQLPDTLNLLGGTLRAGYSLPQGLDAVAKEVAEPMGSELQKAMSEAALGADLEDALGGVGERMDSPDFAWTVLAIGIQREVGGNLNELLTTVAETITLRERLRGEVKALTAEGRLSAMVLALMPPALLTVISVVNPGYVSPLFSTGKGILMLVVGFVAGIIGVLWMRKVVTIDA